MPLEMNRAADVLVFPGRVEMALTKSSKNWADRSIENTSVSLAVSGSFPAL